MRDLVGPPPCVTRVREIRCSPGTRPRHHRVAHPVLSRLASPRPSWRARLPSLLHGVVRRYFLQRRWSRRRMAARRRRRRGARCPLDRRARRETPRSERPAVAGDGDNLGMLVFARRAPCPRRGTALSSPLRYRFPSSDSAAAMPAVEHSLWPYPRAKFREERRPAS